MTYLGAAAAAIHDLPEMSRRRGVRALSMLGPVSFMELPLDASAQITRPSCPALILHRFDAAPVSPRKASRFAHRPSPPVHFRSPTRPSLLGGRRVERGAKLKSSISF